MSRIMQAIVKPRAGTGLELREMPVPTIGAREVLIKTRALSICGTDLHIWHWDTWSANRLKPPLIVGHEFCGDVVEIGKDVTQVKVGDFVSAESHIIDHTCNLCRTGNGHICRNTQIIGVDRDGCFAEYIAMPAENVWQNPPEMPVEIAALMENFGNAVHTAMAMPVVARKVLVTGCGPVGLMAILVARAAGARVIYATDISAYRLNLARQIGAVAINAARENISEKIMRETDGEGIDVLLEMSGAPSAIRDGFAVLKKGGAAAMLGLPDKPFEFDFGDLVILRGITLRGIAGRKMWETWYEARGLIRSGAVDLAPIVTHKFKMSEFEKAFAVMESGESGKVVMVP